jgi:hypothetical protein
MQKKSGETEYELIVRKIRRRSPCAPGLAYLRSHTDYETMFYNIPRYEWMTWLADEFYTYGNNILDHYVYNVEAKRNILMVIVRTYYKELTTNFTKEQKAEFDKLVEVPWSELSRTANVINMLRQNHTCRNLHEEGGPTLIRMQVRAIENFQYEHPGMTEYVAKIMAHLHRDYSRFKTPSSAFNAREKDYIPFQTKIMRECTVMENFDSEPLRKAILAYRI